MVIKKQLEEKEVTKTTKDPKKIQKKKKKNENKSKEGEKFKEKPKEETKKKKDETKPEIKKSIEDPQQKKKAKPKKVRKNQEKKDSSEEEKKEEKASSDEAPSEDNTETSISKKRKIDTKNSTPNKAAKTESKDSPKKKGTLLKDTKKKDQLNGDQEEEEDDDNDDDDDEIEEIKESGTTNEENKNQIYFGNVPFSLDEGSIKNIFKDCGEIVELNLIRDKSTGVFKGYGFIKFSSEESVKKASQLNGKDVNGRSLRVVQGTNIKPKEKPQVKTIYFGNTPLDIREEDIREFFKDCGQIVKIRLLKNPETGEFRRSGFVEFETDEGAKKALKKMVITYKTKKLRSEDPGNNLKKNFKIQHKVQITRQLDQ